MRTMFSNLAVFACFTSFMGCECGGKDGTVTPRGDSGSAMADGATGAVDAPFGRSDANRPRVDAPISTPGAGVFINEVVITPRSDWNDSDGSGLPFDANPGSGEVNFQDQYIELEYSGVDSIDLSEWTLEIRDSSPATHTIADMITRFSPGSSLTAFQPGAYAVLGAPTNSISTDCYIILRSPDGIISDDVEIGGLLASRDTEGDGTGDGAPTPDGNGYARGAFDEAIARLPDVDDTNNDQNDFAHMRATPLAENRPPAPADEAIAPTILRRAEGANFAVTGELFVEFDEPIDAASIDEGITVTAGGIPLALGFSTFRNADRQVVINPIGRLPFATELTITLSSGATGVRDLVGNPLAADEVFTLTTEADVANPGPAVINEICASPVQDWSDSSGGDEVDFNANPGDGAVNSLDEWVELLNRQPGFTDFRSYTLTIYNGPTFFGDARITTRLGDARTHVIGSSAAIAAVQDGDRIVIGNPRGALLSNFYLELRDDSGVLLDHVEVGGNSANSDRGGDGPSNGAPAAGLDGRSTELTDEVVARSPDGADTGNDIADFVQAEASLGAPN